MKTYPQGEKQLDHPPRYPAPGDRVGLGRRLAGIILVLVMIVVGPGCRTAAERHVSRIGPAVARLEAGQSLQDEVDRLARKALSPGAAGGMVVGVVLADGTSHIYGYGTSGQPGDPHPPRGDTLFQIGSLSKVFTAALLTRLVETGQLRYDETVRSILPTNITVTARAGALTLYDLATHTSGLPREPKSPPQLRSYLDYLLHGNNLYAHLTRDYLYFYLGRCQPQPQEPRRFRYSNVGFGLLAHLISLKTGRPTTDLIVEEICRPLGMTDSVFVPDANQQERLAIGHVGNQACWKSSNSPLPPWDMGEVMSAVSGMYSTANDLVQFARANLGQAPHPLRTSLPSLHRVQVASDNGGEALGWIVRRFDNGRLTITFKDGMLAGYRAYLGLDLDHRVAVVVLRSRFDWDDHIGHNLLLRVAAYARSHPRATLPGVPGDRVGPADDAALPSPDRAGSGRISGVRGSPSDRHP